VEKDPQAISIIFQMLLPVFENAILTTHRSKFVQFIVFYICGKTLSSQESSHELNREFAGRLIEAVLDPSLATVTRQSAACYLASFISRAMYTHSDTACEVVAALLRWAEAYLAVFQDEATTSGRRDDRSLCELHALFYTVCQSAFYIMCFRGAETHCLYDEAVHFWASSQKSQESPYPELDHIDISPKRWERICSHKLQPLKYCLESVREEFILVAHAFKLLPIELIRDLDFESEQQSSRNKRRGKLINTPVTSLAGRRQTGGVGGLGHGCNPLDSFFPFDPYLLKHSHAYVDPIYRNWEGGLQEMDDEPLLKDADNNNDSDDGEDMEDNGETDDDGEENYDSDVNEAISHMETKNLSSSLENGNHQISPSAEVGTTHSFGVSAQQYRQTQSTAWSRALKRPRAPSLAENGSW
jgi:RNA polymerase I-specific transcription initiation factor RRN3